MVSYTAAKMMNIVAIGMLAWSLGAAMVLSPEPIVPEESSHPLSAAKEASKQSVGYAADAARKTGEGIRQTVASGMQSTGDAAHSAMETVKDTSQAGLEKLGLATPPPEKSNFQNWESGLQAAKERAAAAVRGAQSSGAEAADKTKQRAQEKEGRSAAEIAREKFENLKKYGQMEPPSTTEVIKEKAAGGYETTKEAAAEAARSVKDTIAASGEKVQEGAHSTFKTAEEAAQAAKEKLESAAETVQKKSGETLGYGGEKSSESAESVSELASKMVQSVQENVNAAGSKAYNTAGSAKDSAYETMGAAYEYAADSLKDVGGKTSEYVRSGDESELSYQEKLKLAAEQAAEMLRQRGKEAVNYMPNVGQGLSLGGKSDSDMKQKASDYMESAKDKAGEYYESTKETIAGDTRERPANWREVFLNGLGIREEADLSKFDVLVGQIYGYWNKRDWTSPGVFHKAGEAWSHATTTTGEAAKTVKDKVSAGFHSVGDHVRHTKDNVAEKANHMTEKASGAFHATKNGVEDRAGDAVRRASDTLPRTGSKINYTVSDSFEEGAKTRPSLSLLRWIAYSTVAWVISSIKAAHLLSFSATYGSSLWVTFVSGYLLSKTLSRQQFGVVQSKMFPTYLRLIAIGQGLCLILYMMLHPWTHSPKAEKLQYLNLWAVLLSTLVNMFFLEPRATKVMFEKMKIEKEEGTRGEEEAKRASDLREGAPPVTVARKSQLDDVNRHFNVLHGWSSTFNLIGLMGETWHLWHLSRALAW